ncbi:glycosyl hydrolase family 95 catalytic domain-containing protein [Microbacterium sp. NPDC055903]
MTVLRFTGAAGAWLERLPLGDGRLGAMTDGGAHRTRFQLNDETAWSGSPDSESLGGVATAEECARLLGEVRALLADGDESAAEAPLKAMQTRYAQSYLPVGDLEVAVDAEEHGLVRELDLATGIHRSRTPELETTSFIDPVTSVLVHVVDGASDAGITLSSPLQTVREESDAQRGTAMLLVRLPDDVAPGHEPDLPGARWGGASLHAAIAARRIAHDGGVVVLVTTATTFAGPGAAPDADAEASVAAAAGRLDRAERDLLSIGADGLAARASDALSALLGDAALRIENATEPATDTATRLDAARRDPRGVLVSDPGLVEVLFDYGRYLLACSSRPGRLPSTLQGIWNADLRPAWGSAYTLNINTEMNYWGAQVTGMPSAAAPLTDFTLALADAAAVQTRRLYDAPGWTVHHNTDAWLYSTAPGRGAGDPRWSFWPLGGAWLGALLTEAWEFGAVGKTELARIWPALRGAAQFALAWHHDGTTSPATSPENAYLRDDGSSASLALTTTMDTALLRALFTRAVRAAEELGLDDDIAAAAADRLRALPAQPDLDPSGRIVEWDRPREEEDPKHRHLSHLWGLYPGVERWDESRRAGAARTLERRGDDSSGWSLVWKLALWARLGRADKASDLLALSLRDANTTSGPWAGGLYPNLFAAHPPFQIDANLGIVGAIAELLLQSHDGIHLLPALPAELRSGSVSGLIARPGIVVGITWRDGELTMATLRARSTAQAGPRLVRWGGRSIAVHIDAGHDTIVDAGSFDTAHPLGDTTTTITDGKTESTR